MTGNVTLIHRWRGADVVRGDVDMGVKAGFVFVDGPMRQVGGVWKPVEEARKVYLPVGNVVGVEYR